MKRFHSKKKSLPTKYVLIILTTVCIISFFVSLVANVKGGPLNTVAGYIFVPMQKGVNSTGNFFLEKTNEFKKLSEVMEENEQLKKQNDELIQQLNINKLDQYQLDNLRELLELSEKYPAYEKVAASVIASDGGNWFSTFTIDKGTDSGISVGMNVMAGSGLVGIVTDVGKNWAKVRSIINDSNRVSAMVSPTGDNFIVYGSLQMMNSENRITFSGLKDDDNEVKVNDPVVTSYISDEYQQGILIGYIDSIEDNSNHLTKSGRIRPVVDFEHLQEVLVIKELKSTGGDK